MLTIRDRLDARVRAWNDTAARYPQRRCLHHLFEQQVARTPDASAVRFEDGSLSFAELDRRANQLAHHLRRLGAGPEVRVAVFGERSLEIVVGFLGILKAGAAYVPVDPGDPEERVDFLIRDARPAVVLTQERLLSRLAGTAARVVCLDRDWPAIAREDEKDPGVDVDPSNLAYVLYTSGSTGQPKGAMNEHRGICNRLHWMQETYRLTSADRVLQKTPFSFDVSGWELFWPLMSGAEMILARPGGHRDPPYLLQLITERGVTVAHFVPSLLRIFLDDPKVEQCRSLRQVIVSGEALSFELQQRFFSRLSADLDNLYGPTEAAIDVSRWRCDRESEDPVVPIGKPIANTQLYILDSSLEPVPVGEVGELHIGGVQVGRGYHDRPELTAERFVPDPFSDTAGARLYKTGDLARYLEDGSIQFLGRIDHQVKVRGVRIELGEIDAALERCSALKGAVTVAHEYGPGDLRLVAYLLPADAATADRPELQAEVRQHLERELPDSMLPSAYVVLDHLPLTASGKIDRAALPAPKAGGAPPGGGEKGETSLERYLLALWSEILGAPVDRHGRFFELGGDSLLAARVVLRIQEKIGERVFVVALLEAPTVASLATHLTERYPEAIARVFGVKGRRRPAAPRGPMGSADLDRLRKLVPSSSALEPPSTGEKNPSAIFLLSTHRSGTTLLRAMLAGHPDLFAASELQLLEFPTLAARRETFGAKDALWLEGTIRAVMEINRCDAEEARRKIAEYESRRATTQEFFRVLQDWVHPRILVDKSPSYALDPGALERAERYFRNPLYIHLVRHPLGMIRSAEDFRMDQVWRLRRHPYSAAQIAELVWTLSHENILEFLAGIPAARQCRVRFEDLVAEPRTTMERLCATLGIRFHPDLMQPYERKERKMLDGIYPESMPMGDTRFHGYDGIEPSVAEKWMEADDPLGEETWRVAARLGYERIRRDERTTRSTLETQRALRRRHRRSG